MTNYSSRCILQSIYIYIHFNTGWISIDHLMFDKSLMFAFRLLHWQPYDTIAFRLGFTPSEFFKNCLSHCVCSTCNTRWNAIGLKISSEWEEVFQQSRATLLCGIYWASHYCATSTQTLGILLWGYRVDPPRVFNIISPWCRLQYLYCIKKCFELQNCKLVSGGGYVTRVWQMQIEFKEAMFQDVFHWV